MQLASGFMQLAAAGRIGTTKHMFTGFFLRKMLIVHQNGDNHILNYHLGRVLSDIRSEVTFFGSTYTSL